MEGGRLAPYRRAGMYQPKILALFMASTLLGIGTVMSGISEVAP